MKCNYCDSDYPDQPNVNLLLSISGCFGCGARKWDMTTSLLPSKPAYGPYPTTGSGFMLMRPIFEFGSRDPVGYYEDYNWGHGLLGPYR